MHTAFLALIVCALAGTPSTLLAETPTPATSGVDLVRVMAVSADPIAESGILATAVEVTGVTNGAQATYYIPYMKAGQPKPRAGQTCEVSWQWHDSFFWTTAGGGARGVRLVSRYACQGEEAFTFK